MQPVTTNTKKLKWTGVFKSKEMLLYLLFGLLTTFINILVYYVLVEWIRLFYLLGNGIAWLVAVVFAFYSNKYFVFSFNKEHIRKSKEEFALFFCSRLFSGMLDMGFMFLLVAIGNMDAFLSKIFVAIGVILFNFMISKYLIFI